MSENFIKRSVDASYTEHIQPVPEKYKDWSIPYPSYKPTRLHVLDHIANSRHPYAANPKEYVPKNPVRYADMVDYEGEFVNEHTEEEWTKMRQRILMLHEKFKGTNKAFELDPITSLPLNPDGRTGIAGPGKLWEWGPILVADPIVTKEEVHPESGKKVIKLLCIKKNEHGKWSLPGGSRDRKDGLNYDDVDHTLTKELMEETGLVRKGTESTTKEGLDMSVAELIFDGKVKTGRETDNSWMITTAKHRHLTEAEAREYVFTKGKDEGQGNEILAKDWIEITPEFLEKMNPGHADFVKDALKRVQK